ncbi:MAG: carboxypeptidase-like regulatory domain-containing protein [Planctomycetota bacterium]
MRRLALGTGLLLAAWWAEPAQAQTEYRLGTVVDGETGTPLRNVTVAYRTASQNRQIRWWQGRPTGWRTEGDGTFRVQAHLAGSEVVAIDPERGCSGFAVVGGPKERLVLKLHPGNTVTGVARDADGRPLPDLQISFRVRGVGTNHTTWLEGPGTMTDADGRYTLHGLPPGLEFLPGVEPTERVRGLTGTPELVRFEGLGEATERDLEVARRPGREITFRLQPPGGAAVPASVRITWISRRTEPAASAHTPRGSVVNRDGTMEVRSYVRDADQLITHTQRAWDHDWDPAEPAVTLFWPVGTHALQIAAGNWIAVVPEETVGAAAEPQTRTLAWTQRARLYVQLTDAEGAPLARGGVRVSVNHTIRRPRSSHGFGAGNGTTDDGGLFELTPYLPPLRHAPADGTTVQVRVHFASRELTFPNGSYLRWTLEELRDLMKQGGPGGHLVLNVVTVPPVAQAFRFVDGRGRPAVHVWVQPQLAGAQRGQTNPKGEVTLQLPSGSHTNLRFHLGNEYEVDPLAKITVPAEAPITVPVRRVVQFQIPITVQGQTERPRRGPGRVTCTAYDAQNRVLPRARAWLGANVSNWIVYVRVPDHADRVNLTLAGVTKLVRLTGGRAPTNLAWTVPDLHKRK